MRVELRPPAISEADADLLAIGLRSDDSLPDELADAPGAADADGGFKKLTMLRPARPRRALVVGLGPSDELDPERLRVAAALAVRQARRYRARTIAWLLPELDRAAAAIVAGTILADHRLDRFKAHPSEQPPPRLELLRLLTDDEDAGSEVEPARVAAEAANRARELQALPANVADPAYLAGRADEIAAAHGRVEIDLLGPDRLEQLGMGGILAVAAGSDRDPVLIALRYRGGGSRTLGLVGKAVTFDTGGISLKPAQGMQEMKMDMSGGAAVLEATAAIAELGLGVDLLAVVPAVENMPGGGATRPGDVITQLNGKTVEVNNTDAEGRLILADALTWCARQGAERIVDLATLTGAVVTALGSSYAAVLGSDDELVELVRASGEAVGELAWRLPLHPEYKELMRGTIADLTNAAPKRKAGTATAAAFLEEFVEDASWAHVDIAGTSWDVGREYVGKGPTGFGVRLLVELARAIEEEG